MIYNSHYWIEGKALERLSNHEIVVLEKDKNGCFTLRHAEKPEDWIHNLAAYINDYKRIEGTINTNEVCRCLIVDVLMK